MESVPQAPRRGAVIFIFITVLLDVLALGVMIPVLPKLVLSFSEGDAARTAKLLGLFATIWAAMQLVASPVLGALSDRFGRRRIILLSNFGLSFDYVLMALSQNWEWLLVGRIISGVTAASIPTAYAYIADVTPPEKRAASFGLIGAAFGIGFVCGPVVGGVLGHWSPRLPFWVSAALSLANAMYGLFVLPESLTPERRSPFSWKRANPVGSLMLLLRHSGLFALACVNFLSYLSHVVLPSIFVLYAGYRYGWNEWQVGAVLGFVGVGSAVVQGGLIKPTLSRFGERNTLLIGLAFGIAGFAVAGIANSGLQFLSSVPLMSLWGLAGPAGMGLLSSKVGSHEQGQLQGANNSLRAISEIVGPSIFTFSFAYFIREGRSWTLPGAPFLISAVILFAATALAWKVAFGATPASEPMRKTLVASEE